MALGPTRQPGRELMSRLLTITLVGAGPSGSQPIGSNTHPESLCSMPCMSYYSRVSTFLFCLSLVLLAIYGDAKAANVIGLSCPYAYVDGNDGKFSYTFVVDLQRQKVLQYEDKHNSFHEMHNVQLLEDNISFFYETRGARPPRPEEDLLLRMEEGSKRNNILEAYVSTNIEINRRSLAIRIIRRYYNTMLDHGIGTCSMIRSRALPPHQF